jgi:hypothetical protein
MHQPHSLSQDSLFYTIQDNSHTQDYTMHQPHSLSQDSLFYTIQDLSHTQDYTSLAVLARTHGFIPFRSCLALLHCYRQDLPVYAFLDLSYTGLYLAPAPQS